VSIDFRFIPLISYEIIIPVYLGFVQKTHWIASGFASSFFKVFTFIYTVQTDSLDSRFLKPFLKCGINSQKTERYKKLEISVCSVNNVFPATFSFCICSFSLYLKRILTELLHLRGVNSHGFIRN